MSRVAGLVAAAALIMLAGCGGDPQPPAASTPPAEPSSASAAPGSAGPSVLGAECLNGTWRLVRFIGLGASATYGTGQGGDVTVEFANGRYTLTGQGKRPYTVNLAGETARLFVDGTAAGTYQPDGTEMTFAVGKATGQATLQAGDQKQTVPMESVSKVIAPQGKATLACPEKVLLIALPTVRLELER